MSNTIRFRAAVAEIQPDADSVENLNMSDVIGNKTDAASRTADTASLVALVRKTLDEATEVEHHLHGYERWYGLAVTPNAELVRAEAIVNYTNSHVIAPHRVDAGNDNWGSWVQILGSSDTPFEDGKAYFDFHKLLIVDAENATSNTFIQIGSGASGTEALSNKTYTTIAYQTAASKGTQVAVNFMDKRQAAGTKVWARALAIGEATSWIDFYIGLHEYDS